MAAKGTNPDSAAWDAALKHRPSYAKPLAEYFATYEVKERGLKKWVEEARRDWIAAGCKDGGPEFPPLDDPPKVLDWWLAHKKHAAPARLLSLAGKPEAREPLTSSPEQKGAQSEGRAKSDATPKRTTYDINTIEGVDLSGAARHQRRILAGALKEHADAMADQSASESTISLRAKRVNEAMEQLRTIEASLVKQQREAGELVNLDEIRAELAPLLANVAGAFVELLRDRLGLPQARARELADECFSALTSTRFASTSGAPAAAAAA